MKSTCPTQTQPSQTQCVVSWLEGGNFDVSLITVLPPGVLWPMPLYGVYLLLLTKSGIPIQYSQQVGNIIIYLCTETQHYCLLTGGAVKIKSGPLWF